MWKRQTGKSESWAHEVINTCPGSPWCCCCCCFLGRRRLQDSRGWNLPTVAGAEGWLWRSVAFRRAVPKEVTCADRQSLSLSNNRLRSAAKCGGFLSALQVLYLNWELQSRAGKKPVSPPPGRGSLSPPLLPPGAQPLGPGSVRWGGRRFAEKVHHLHFTEVARKSTRPSEALPTVIATWE